MQRLGCPPPRAWCLNDSSEISISGLLGCQDMEGAGGG